MSDLELNDDVHEEEDRLPARAILGATGVVVGAVILLSLVTFAILTAREARLRPSRDFPEEALGPPRPQAEVESDLFDRPDAAPAPGVRARSLLDRYGWVDRDRRIVHIPIDRAIDLLLQGAPP